METLTIDLKKKKSFEIGQQGDHNALCIHFINMKNVGTNKKYIYYTIDGIENCVPLTNDRFIIGYPLTAHSGIASAQLISKLNDNSIIKLSNVFAMHIKESKGYKDSGEYPVDPNIQSSYDLLDDLINETKDLINNYNYATLMEKLTQASSEATTSADTAKKCADELKNSTDFINTLDDKVAVQDSKIKNIEASTSYITTKQNTKIAALHTRMSEFTSLKDGSTTGDAELIDARIGADGTKYPSAGDAMRVQVEQLNETLDNLNKDVFSNITSLNLSSVFTDISNVNQDMPVDWVSLWSSPCYPTDNHKLIKYIEINSPKGGSVTLYKAKLNTDNTATILVEENFTLIKGVNIVKPSTPWIVKTEQNETIMLKSNSLGSYGYDTTDTGLSLRYFPSNHKIGAEKVYGAFNVYFTELSSKLKFNNIIIVSKENGDYGTVTDAVKNANNGDLIYIKNGMYENEIIEAWGKNISIVGENKYKTIIENTTGTYSTPALEMSIGLLSNVTIHAKNKGVISKDSNGWSDYAVHIEHDSLFNNTLFIDNVILKSDEQSAIGIGTRGNSTIEFHNCEFYSDSTFAVWLHDTTSADTKGETNVKFKNCIAYTSTGDRIIRIGSQRVEGQHTNLTFVNNVFCTANGKNVVYKTPDYNTGSVTTDSGNFGLIGYDKTILCFGNNINDINFN